MHILYIGTLPPHPGGSAVVAGQVLPALAARGHRLTAISGTTQPPLHRETLDLTALAGVRTYRYAITENVTDTGRIVLADVRRERPAFRAAFRRAMAAGRPDVVVAGRTSFAIDAANVARAMRVPYIQVEHSRRGGPLASTEPTYVAAVTRAFDRSAVSILVAEHLREVHPERPAVVVTNGVEADRFRPMPRDAALAAGLGIEPDATVILHASNLKPLKRARDIVAALPGVLRQVPGARLVIVGDGAERAALEAAVSVAGVAAAVRFVDWQPRDRMPEWYALADIVVMASTTEARSMAGLEAMAAGRVLIATDIPAFRETVTDGRDGLLFPVGDVAGLADRIVTAATDPGLRSRLGAAARANALGWTIERMVSGWEAAIEGVVRGSAGTRDARSRSAAGAVHGPATGNVDPTTQPRAAWG